MKSITKHILNYRKVLVDLWNQNFVISQNSSDHFIFEIDKAFSLIEEGLFNSLVIAKTFDFPIERSKDGYFTEIIVKSASANVKTMAAKIQGFDYSWINLDSIPNDCVFNYINVFDWETNEGKNGEFIRVRLTESESWNQYIGYDFLFHYDEVLVYKI